MFDKIKNKVNIIQNKFNWRISNYPNGGVSIIQIMSSVVLKFHKQEHRRNQYENGSNWMINKFLEFIKKLRSKVFLAEN